MSCRESLRSRLSLRECVLGFRTSFLATARTGAIQKFCASHALHSRTQREAKCACGIYIAERRSGFADVDLYVLTDRWTNGSSLGGNARGERAYIFTRLLKFFDDRGI